MKIADGDYTVFIDADDLVQPYYIKTILNKIENSTFDYCYFG
jgi:cellulose synthase/poly-beta-1,6-N-acetylglucosamine synthase-like glycosyltransferase